ncbi:MULTISPECIES: hypothetical protein [unclassified Nostoc]|uniref:hypothetical protein n=1 Tax=unclassified Nostoc TaxID=2593658 RepID=UPI002AD2D751|nr:MULTISPECIES: hypothetical protein [unclassified Nostoc]MDZ8126619.1 hypothetical protein [Nostoc sp. CmiVER01]MDZ8227844.1 hypothetical protein [Nostoc sp. ChiVER01]
MTVSKITDLIIAYQTEIFSPEGDDIHLIEGRVWELDQNLELTTEEIFEIVCQEYHLNPELIEKELNCKCPFALAGFLREFKPLELSYYLKIE